MQDSKTEAVDETRSLWTSPHLFFGLAIAAVYSPMIHGHLTRRQ